MDPRTAKQALFVLLVLAWLTGLFSHAMNRGVSHDANLYITSSVLIQDHALYEDFAYLQMPYLPLVYGAFFRMTGASHPMLLARCADLLFMAMSAVLTFFIAHRITRDLFVSRLASILLALNGLVLYNVGRATNDMMAMAFALLGLLLFLKGYSTARLSPPLIFVAGICLAIATCTKLYYAPIVLPFLLISLLFPRTASRRHRLGRGCLPLVAGLLIGSLPALYYLLRDPEVFMFNNLGYHSTTTRWWGTIGHLEGISLLSKLGYARGLLFEPTTLVLLLAALFTLWTRVGERRLESGPVAVAPPAGALQLGFPLALLLVAFTTVTAFAPSPSHRQYFAPAVPFVIVLIVCGHAALSRRSRRYMRILLTCLVIVSALSGGVTLYKEVDRLTTPGRWAVFSLHESARKVRAHVETVDRRGGGKVATLFPLYVVEAGLEIYRELATGPFLYRVGDLIPEDMRKRLVATSPSAVGELLDRDPPAAILVGFEGELDLPLLEYAQARGYARVAEGMRLPGGSSERAGVLYLRRRE